MKPSHLVCLLTLAAWSLPVSAQEEAGLRVEFGTSLVWGNAYELVLRNETYNHPISQLTWPISPSVAVQLQAWLPWSAVTSTKVSLRASRTLAAGTLVDEDWDFGSIVYFRSEHSSYLTAHLAGTIEQQFSWDQGALTVGALYRWSNWEGWDGTYRYQSTGGTTQGVYSGLGLAYRQEWLIPFIGAQWTFPVGGWTWTPMMRVSPYTWCYARDDHLLSAKRFTYLDFPVGGVYGEWAAEFAFRDARNWDWGARVGWEMAWGAVGDTTATFPSKDSVGIFSRTRNGAGAWFEEASVALFVRN